MKAIRCYLKSDQEEYVEYELSNICDWYIEHIVSRYCKNLYENSDGWEWMPRSNETIIAEIDGIVVGEYAFYIEYDPVFYVNKVSL